MQSPGAVALGFSGPMYLPGAVAPRWVGRIGPHALAGAVGAMCLLGAGPEGLIGL
jgi:hypothetical protein